MLCYCCRYFVFRVLKLNIKQVKGAFLYLITIQQMKMFFLTYIKYIIHFTYTILQKTLTEIDRFSKLNISQLIGIEK